jgi:Ice-binding-like
MNKFQSVTKSLRWFMALLVVAFVAGCGGSSGSVALSSTKAITAYSLAGVTGTVNETAKTIAVAVPYGTNVTALVATFTAASASVTVGTPAVAQVSGTTANNFTSPVVYKVTAADGTTATYTVTVTVASITAKAITAYSIAGATGTINETAKTIAVTVPNGTNVTALVATFTSTGVSVKVGTTAQVSGTTPNDFSSPVVYTVTAGDASTAAYTVTVTAASTSSKAITAFSINGATGTITGTAISVTMPLGTNVSAQIATFASTGSSVKVGTTVQVSGTTPNNFSSPVVYTVTAADASTTSYTVTVTLGQVVCGGTSGTNCVNLGTAANYAILDEATVTFTPIATTITTPTITGDIGLSPAAASFITGFALTLDPAKCFSTSTQVTGKLYAADYSSANGCAAVPDTATVLTTAVGDKNTAYNNALLKAPSGGGLVTACPGTGAFDGTVVAPLAAGVYTCGVNVSIPTNFTLNGNATDVWVFQITGSLSQAAATSVQLTGGALPQNVFWIVSNGVSIGANAHMQGVVLSATNISLVTGASVNGRLLGRTGVLMDSNTVVQP